MRPRPPAKPPVFRLPTATVYSCGYRHLGLDWSTDKDIDELSQELMSVLGKKLIVVMECLMFHDVKFTGPRLELRVGRVSSDVLVL